MNINVEVRLTCQEQRPARLINDRVRGIKFWENGNTNYATQNLT